jgi:hypothetical protein
VIVFSFGTETSGIPPECAATTERPGVDRLDDLSDSTSHARFAHRLLDGDVDVVHGHSSHHPRPMEVYNHKLVRDVLTLASQPFASQVELDQDGRLALRACKEEDTHDGFRFNGDGRTGTRRRGRRRARR